MHASPRGRKNECTDYEKGHRVTHPAHQFLSDNLTNRERVYDQSGLRPFPGGRVVSSLRYRDILFISSAKQLIADQESPEWETSSPLLPY